jgi:hypothetical protein
MLVDANILLYAIDTRSPLHERAEAWLTAQLNGVRRVAFAWWSLLAFVRISTNPRASEQPLAPAQAWQHVEDWLASDTAWIAHPTDHHARVLGRLITTHELRGNLVSDAAIAALAIEHGLTVCSADTDFARFQPEVRWLDPLAR